MEGHHYVDEDDQREQGICNGGIVEIFRCSQLFLKNSGEKLFSSKRTRVCGKLPERLQKNIFS